MKRRHPRCVPVPVIGPLPVFTATFLVVVVKNAPHDFGRAAPTESGLRVTILRGGNAWGVQQLSLGHLPASLSVVPLT
jgi:hypothetical protein